MTSHDAERLFTPPDHTAAVAFCLRERERLAADAHRADSVLRRAADIADGRVQRVLASASRRRPLADEPTLEGLRIGLRIAEGLVEDGARTIYRPGYWTEEGMLVTGRSATDADVSAAARQAAAQLAEVGATAAVRAGSRCRGSSPDEVVHEVIMAAVAASVPVALVLAQGAQNQ